MISCRQLLPGSLLIALLSGTVALAAEWPPALDRNNPTVRTNDGRRIDRYTHGARAEWGYAQRPRQMGGSTGSEESGQINAYFRWRNLQDTANKFAIQLWLAHRETADLSTSLRYGRDDKYVVN